jgi:hypothetical protein
MVGLVGADRRGGAAMLKVPTVFVIGAGAGVDVGMPLGDQLSHIIGEKLRIKFEEGNRQTSGNKLIMEALRRHASANQQDANLYHRAAFGVAGGIAYSRSIDSYLHAHKDNKPLQVCGKLAIAQTILEHEKGSALVVQTGHQFRNPTKANESWLGAFMYGLQERIVVNENLSDIFKHLTIVNFNYDRCVEHFLFHAMQAWSLKDEREIAELMKGLNIYHPYGSVGDLPWQSGDGIEFGGGKSTCLGFGKARRGFGRSTKKSRTKLRSKRFGMPSPLRIASFSWGSTSIHRTWI